MKEDDKGYSEDLLKFAIKNGILDLPAVNEMMEKQKRQAFLNQHIYKIWEGANGFWYTYLPDEEKSRIMKKKKTRKEIEDCIIKYYKQLEEDPSIGKLFKSWINEKLEFGEIQKQTYDRYKIDYDKFIKNTDFERRKIRSVTERELEIFIKTNIRQYNLTNKAYAGLRTVIMGIFKYAKKNDFTDLSISNFFGDLDLSKKAFAKKIKLDEDEVFTDVEVEKIIEIISESKTVTDFALLFAFYTGLRAGELAALEFSDIKGDMLTVNKTEIRYKGENGKYIYEIAKHAKTDAGNREIVITENAIEIIDIMKSMNKNEKYVFGLNDGDFRKGKNFTSRLKRICKKLKIKERSIHKARKTYGTKLLNNEVDERIIIKQMGHTDIKCTRAFYHYNNKTSEETKSQIRLAIDY